MIRCVDWRDCPSRDIANLVAAERTAWLDDLHWDVTQAWRVLEPARRSGQLPGFVAEGADGAAVGWTSFLLHRDCVQILAFVAQENDVAAALVNAILHSHEAGSARSIVFCVRAAAPALAGSLALHGFDVEPYRYLASDLRGDDPLSDSLRPWNDDSDAVVPLFARAYGNGTTVRAFAPNGTLVEWQEYVTALVNTPGCGRFAPALSFVLPHPERAGELAGAVLVTDLGPSTVHVAQIAVAPDTQGLGIGTTLMRGARAAAWSSGYRRMTLLVAASNLPAVTVYERLGLVDRSSFLVATRRQPILSATLALETGVDRTRL